MRLRILAVGRARNAPEDALAASYLDRARGLGAKLGVTAIDCVVVETSRATGESARKVAEAKALKKRMPPGAMVIVLEAGVKAETSEAFTRRLAKLRNSGERDVVFVIGGPDGLAEDMRRGERLAFGAQTWPHLLVRVMLAEQLYRALSILAGHPYHRGGKG